MGENPSAAAPIMQHHVLLLGTRHGYQYGSLARAEGSPCTPAQEQAFRAYVGTIILHRQPSAIVEELNDDAVREACIDQSVLQDLARAHGLLHRFCEPDRAQRKAMRIRDDSTIRIDALMREQGPEEADEEIARELKRQFDQREDFWCTRLAELPAGRVLLVCGADHSSTISQRLHALGAQCELLDAYWLAPGDTPTRR